MKYRAKPVEVTAYRIQAVGDLTPCRECEVGNEAAGWQMTSRDFCYFLQGLFELAKPEALTKEQTELVRRHLAMVFAHEIDPSMGDEKAQKILDDIHAAADQAKRFPQPWQTGPDGPGGIKMRC
jgi:hypothetical protein